MRKSIVVLMLAAFVLIEGYLWFSPLHEKCAASHYARNDCVFSDLFDDGFECEQQKATMSSYCQEFHKEAVNVIVFIVLILGSIFLVGVCYEIRRRKSIT